MIRLSDYIIKRIEEEGVRHIFYVPGGQCVYLTDALRRNKNIEAISVHHEQTAAMAALSYSLYNQNFGACLVTTGCAGTNTMTGVLHAWQDSIPCIFISGQQNYENTIAASGLPLRQVGVQEADIVTLVSSITKYAAMVTDPDDIAMHLDRAIYLAKSGRKGPVWLDIPLDVQNAMIDETKLKRFYAEDEVLAFDPEDIVYAEESIRSAKRPVVIAGQGIRSAGAADLLKKWIDIVKIPVVFTRFSIDMMPYDHEYNFGVAGSVAANREANFIVQNSDLVISVGSRLSIDTTGPQREQFAREAKIIVVDIDAAEHRKKGVKIDRFLHLDAKIFLETMIERSLPVRCDSWVEKCRHWKNLFSEDTKEKYPNGINIKYYLEKLSECLPAKSTVISDAGMTGAAVPANCHVSDGGRIIHSFAQGEMGYALPAAIGIAALSEGKVFAISGEGSFMMNLQELQTVVRNNFDIKIIINNNNGYSGVRHGQKAHFRGKSIGTDPGNGITFPDFSRLAQAFDIPYFRIETDDEIETITKKITAIEGPCICEVYCDDSQYDLHNALVTYGKRKFGFRPIEDQSPFIDRDVFFREMIVKPMETSYGTPV
ncbi:MAG: thiamine pyrophosphate-binding protein [Porcipelethomonas sp.]